MKKINPIKLCKKLVDMPYNQLNLDNYQDILRKYFPGLRIVYTNIDSPTQLMSGLNENACLIGFSGSLKITLVGKGILFDSGGYDLKRGMADMKCDMAGMATALVVANETKCKAVCPVTTNFIHNSKIIPGDILKIGDKKVTVTDTDAEGRLILAEALSRINQTKDKIIVTVATLTGVVGYAVGDKATGVFTPNDKLWKMYKQSADEAKELCWRLPLWDYLEKENFKGNNIKNYVKTKPGASMAALFLKQFIKYPNNWIHLDIAYSAWDNKKEKATGNPVQSLINFVKRIK